MTIVALVAYRAWIKRNGREVHWIIKPRAKGEGGAMEKMQSTVQSDSLHKGKNYFYAKTVDGVYFWEYIVHCLYTIGAKAALNFI
jgi:hypothetical protein